MTGHNAICTRGGRRFATGATFGAVAFVAGLIPEAVQAHTAEGVVGGFTSGFTHPIFGFDHLLAMFAVGVWGAQMGGRAVWTLPIVFPLIMAVGGFLGVVGIPVPQPELMIAASVLVLGLAIALAWKAPEWIAIAIVGAFAIFHGHAHGTELPSAVDPLAYGIGFVTATGLIHIIGIAFGLLLGHLFQGWGARIAGSAVSLGGVYFLAQ